MPSAIVTFIAGLMVERPARNAGAERLAADLEASLDVLRARFAAAADPAKAALTLRHILGIERWGQQRLRVALGDAPFVRDGHQPYLPATDLDLAGLLRLLVQTRTETVALARRIAASSRGDTRVEHNALGPLSAAGWLRYLRVHGDLEARRVKTR